ncbi:MAG TPA: hypothetical protein VIM51_13685 [Desulfosporosinus sp.]
MSVYYLEEYKQRRISKDEPLTMKTGLTARLSKPQLKVCLPIVIAGLTYISFIGFASLLIR